MTIIVTSDMLVDQMGQIANERDTYRDLCGELLKELKGAQSTLAHCRADIGYRNRQDATAISIHRAITRAESVMGENSNG